MSTLWTLCAVCDSHVNSVSCLFILYTTTEINSKGGSGRGKYSFCFPFAPAKYEILLFHSNMQNYLGSLTFTKKAWGS